MRGQLMSCSHDYEDEHGTMVCQECGDSYLPPHNDEDVLMERIYGY